MKKKKNHKKKIRIFSKVTLYINKNDKKKKKKKKVMCCSNEKIGHKNKKIKSLSKQNRFRCFEYFDPVFKKELKSVSSCNYPHILHQFSLKDSPHTFLEKCSW